MSESWKDFIEEEKKKSYFSQLSAFVQEERLNHKVYPPRGQVLTALQLTPLDKVRVVIMGQDPYHQPGQAQGLAFSVPDGVAIPPSLRNIYKEISLEFGVEMPKNGNLSYWAGQGVLLLNTLLTVRDSSPMSHKGQGWEQFTDNLIRFLCKKDKPMIFALWGRHARDKVTRCLSSEPLHPQTKTLSTTHPSPLSAHAGFLGCGHFKEVNRLLKERGEDEIDWTFAGDRAEKESPSLEAIF